MYFLNHVRKTIESKKKTFTLKIKKAVNKNVCNMNILLNIIQWHSRVRSPGINDTPCLVLY